MSIVTTQDQVLHNNSYIYYQGNIKQYLRLTVSSRPPTAVIAVKKVILEKAGIPDFGSALRAAGHTAMDSKNTR